MRTCQHKGCTTPVARGGERGPWPKYCVPHRRQREALKRRKPVTTDGNLVVACLDCLVTYVIPPSGNYPSRCERCTMLRRRKQSAERQRRFRERHAEAE